MGVFMEDIHKNYDSVFKDAMVLFKDKTLEFLGLHGIAPITEPLSTEIVRVEVNSEILDLTFGLQDKRGLHLEEEVNLSYDDMLRFGSYHLELSRVYKREFITVIFVKEPATINEIRTEQFIFTPIIVQCSEVDADEILVRLKKGIAEGKPINELELIYLPLFSSKQYTATELFKETTALINEMKVEDNLKRKIAALSIVLASKVVEKTVLEKYIEELRRMGNVIIEVFEEYGKKMGREENREETAKKMLADKLDPLDIMKYTGIDSDQLRRIRNSMYVEVV